jgi:uncharacterized membrane protein
MFCPGETRSAPLRLSHSGWQVTLAPMSTPTRVLLVLTALVVVAHLVFAAAVYGALPAQIPTHFNAAGIPDRFGPRSNWWFLPVVNVLSAALTLGVTLLLPRQPALLNVPRKAELLALPLEAQRDVVRQAQPGMLALGLSVAGVFAYLQYATWVVATGGGSAGLGGLIVVVPIVSVAILPAILVPVGRELERQQASARR